MHRHGGMGQSSSQRMQFLSWTLGSAFLKVKEQWVCLSLGVWLYKCLSIAVWGTLHQAVSMKSSSYDSWDKETEVPNSMLSFQTAGLGQDHYPKVRVSAVQGLLSNWNSSAPAHGTKEDSSRHYF